MKKVIKKVSLILAVVVLSQNVFAAKMYVERNYKSTLEGVKWDSPNIESNGVLYDNDQIKVIMENNHFMKCNVAINKVKPNSKNIISVMVNEIQIVRYDDFSQLFQPFNVWTDPNVRGDLHIKFNSVDMTTGKPNEDVFVVFSDVEVYPYRSSSFGMNSLSLNN